MTFSGKSVDAIIKQIDESGWEDFPDSDGQTIAGRCPECYKKFEEKESCEMYSPFDDDIEEHMSVGGG